MTPPFDFRDTHAPGEDRYARQRLIPGWRQDRIARARILIAGAGALGNEGIKNLALLGAGNLCIVDFDRVEVSNLARCVLFRPEDVGRSKAQAAARAARELNPGINISALDGDIGYDLGEGELRSYDLVLACVDSIGARWRLNRLCRRAGVAWFNGGMSASVGQVSLHAPHTGACYECGMTRSMWQRMSERRSCLLAGKPMAEPQPQPASILPASLTAALLVQQAVAWLHRDVSGPARDASGSANGMESSADALQPGQMLSIDAQNATIHRLPLRQNPRCAAHASDAEWIAPAISLDAAPESVSVAEVLRAVPDAVAWLPSQEMVTGLECAACGTEAVQLPVRRLRRQDLACPRCAALRLPLLASPVQPGSALAGETLHRLGVPHQAILDVQTRQGLRRVELTVPRPGRIASAAEADEPSTASASTGAG
jgi:molybdopterin/thiamine biosynthesis adenylyltransferase